MAQIEPARSNRIQSDPVCDILMAVSFSLCMYTDPIQFAIIVVIVIVTDDPVCGVLLAVSFSLCMYTDPIQFAIIVVIVIVIVL